MNRLYYGDCLTVMQDMRAASVDLIYLDPPFNSNRQYNSIYKDETGRPLPDQVEAFCDMWELDRETERAIQQMPILLREQGIDDDVVEFWRIWTSALRKTQPRLLAYLSYMVQRLAFMKGLLKPSGSVYLHCDPTASHYIKVMMDGIFGHRNFRNEITWQRTTAHSSAKRYGPNYDTILFYTGSDSYTWNWPRVRQDAKYIKRLYKHRDEQGPYHPDSLTGAGVRHGSSGAPWRGIDPTNAKRHWAIPRSVLDPADHKLSSQEKLDKLDAAGLVYWPPDGTIPRYKRRITAEDETRPAQSLWTDIPPINSQAKERLGYATQKPLPLLERIIQASSNPGDTVFDPFCGCATTLEAAHTLGREWIGIDIAIHAIKRVAKVRLEERLGLVEGKDFTIDGVPRNVEGARDLWERDKYHFQKWAVEEVDGFVTSKRTSDGGIDGRLYFAMPDHTGLVAGDTSVSDTLESMVIEVKGGANVGISVVRDLRGVLERDEARLAGLIVMDDLGDRKMKSFEREMAAAGDLNVRGVLYPRMQILTVADILEGTRFKTPGAVGRHTLEPRLPGVE